MKEQKLIEKKPNEKYKKINSPMKTLFKLTVKIKRNKKGSYEKRRIYPFSTIFTNNSQLNKASSVKDIKENEFSSTIFGTRKQKISEDRQIYNYNNIYINSLKDKNIYNNDYNNFFYNKNNLNENNNHDDNYIIKNPLNNYQNVLNNDYNGENETILSYNEKTKMKYLKQQKNKKTKNYSDINDSDKGNNITSLGVFNYKIYQNMNNNSKYNIKTIFNSRNKQVKNNINDSEVLFTNRSTKFNNQKSIKKKQNKDDINYNKKINQNLSSEIIEPKELYNNLENKNYIISPSQNLMLKGKKNNIQKENNNIVKTNNLLRNKIYSPKRGIARVHSQKNIINRNKKVDKNSFISDKRASNKNQSVKDLSGYTYTKKKYLPKTRNEINNTNIIDLLNENLSNINYDNYNIITKREEYDIEPDIYPEIRINLRDKNAKPKNNSVINKYNNYYDYDIKSKDYLRKKNFNKKTNNLYTINKRYLRDENLINDNDRNNNSFINNKSLIFSNENISLTNKSFSDNGLISNKDLKNNIKEDLISIKDMSYILVLEEKIKDLTEYSLKTEKMEIIRNYCFELINYFINYSMNNYIKYSIIDIIEKNNIIIYNNFTFFSFIILYYLTFDEETFGTVNILIKEILKLIYSNIILIINHSKKRINNNSEENISILFHIINNVENKYLHNKELYLDDNEYLLMDKKSHLSFEETLDFNLNFIIKNIHTIISNIKNATNVKIFTNIFKELINIKFEELTQFFIDKILKTNFINSSLKCSMILKNQINKMNTPYIENKNKKKFSLVISLDETLIHFKEDEIDNNKGVIQLRPGIVEFFDSIKPYYEIIVFSSGNKKYNDLIINSVDEINRYIDYSLWRDHCLVISNDFVKDISRIGRPINRIIIVDNIPQNYRLHKENGINIKSFYGDNPNDKILLSLSKILIQIGLNEEDAREGIKKYWNDIINKITSNIYANYYYK